MKPIRTQTLGRRLVVGLAGYIAVFGLALWIGAATAEEAAAERTQW